MYQLRKTAVTFGLAASFVWAENIHVPGDAPTIQIAISQAQPFDTIIVAPGTYFEAISFGGKVITVQSTNPTDAATVAATIINAGGLGGVVTFAGGEDANTAIDGFTLTGGTIGINGNATTATIRRCVIRDNSSFGIHRANGRVEDSQIRNQQSFGIYESFGDYRRCIISNNTGHGVALCGGTFSDSIIENTMNGAGVSAGNARFVRCVIRGNGGSGFVSVFQSSVNQYTGTIEHSYIVGNKGSGLEAYGSDGGAIIDSVIAGNRGNGVSRSSKKVLNCTIANNEYYGFVQHTGMIRHCIIWNNPSGALHASSTPTFSGTVNPFFLVPGVWDAVNMVWIDGDYHLTPNSPYIDAGDPFYLLDPTAPLIDITGSPRVVGARIDIGAFEFQADCVGEDFDGDGTADVCDPDIDDDGIPNINDVCDDTPVGVTVDFEGRPEADLNHDCTVNLLDFAIFQTDFIGP